MKKSQTELCKIWLSKGH